MARQKGIIKLSGKIGDLSFYQSKDGFLAREKGGVEAHRIKNDPAFIRTRENGSEFGGSAKSGKLLRDSLRSMVSKASDGRVTARLTKLMTVIKNLDTTSVRGQRNVGTALVSAAAKTKLKGFNFNDKAVLGSILFNPYDVDLASGEISLLGFVPAEDLNVPQGATHISLKGAWANIDFATGEADIQLTNEENLPIDNISSDVFLTPLAAAAGTGVNLHLLMVEFFQEVNGVQYSLKNGSYNALSIVEVQ